MVGDFELGTDGPNVVVVGVDGSPTSMRAAAYAAGLARRSGARLVVVHVPRAPLLTASAPPTTIATDALAEVSDEITRQVREGAARLGIVSELVQPTGDPFTEIARVADEVRAPAGREAPHRPRPAKSFTSSRAGVTGDQPASSSSRRS